MELQVEEKRCPGVDTIAARACGRLGGKERQHLEHHLGDCAPCRDLAAALAGSVLTRLPAKVAGASALLPPGTALGRYRVTRLLGAGGMGVVYAAHDPELGRDVAVKVLHPTLAENPDAARAFLLAEARAMARLRHPNVVAVHDAGAFGDRVYVAMELIAGQTLRGWLAAARPWRQVVDVMCAAGRGLAAAHRAGLVHRDFKPENVLIGGGGEVCVTDFGIALHAGTGNGELAGTPMYMAPEQRAGAPLDARADQFAFALVLCEALSGLRPDQSFDAIRPPRDRVFPSWLRRVCARALSASPAARFPSMDVLLDRLDRRTVQLRRRAAATALCAAAAVAIAVRIGSAAATAPDACRLAGSPPAGLWSQARAGEVAAALARHDAADRAPHVLGAVERWRDRWSAMRVDACRASRMRGTASAEFFDLRMACLDREAARVDAVLDALSSAHPTSVGGLTAALAAGDRLDACAADRVLLEPWRAPSDPDRRADAGRLRGELADAEAAIVAGRIAEGVDRASDVAAAAEVAELPALRAEGLLIVALGQIAAGTFPAAQAALGGSIVASEHGDHERAKVTALLTRAEVRWNLDRGADAEDDLRVAAAVARRLDDRVLSSEVAHGEAMLRTYAGELDAALAAIDRALTLRASSRSRDPLTASDMLTRRGDILLRLGRVAEARGAAALGLAIAHRVLGDAHPFLSSPLVTLAQVSAREGHNVAALVYAATALAVASDEAGLRGDHPAVLVAELQAMVGNGDVARAVLDHAIDRHVSAGGGLATTAELVATRGRVRYHAEDADGAISDLLRATEMIEQSRGAGSSELAPALETLGNAYLLDDRPQAALEVARRALAIRRRQVGAGHHSLFEIERLVGRAHLALGRPATAVPHLEAAAATMAAEPLSRASVEFVLGRALVDAGGDRRRAVALVHKARATFAAAVELDFDLEPIDRWLAEHGARRSPVKVRRQARRGAGR